MSIDSYMHDLENVQDLYQLHWVIPYGSCYTQAHANYLRTMSQQAATDKLKMEMLMLVASVGFGGAMSGLFGTAVVRTALSQGALNVVCNRNMTRVFRAMAWVEGNAAASHMASAAWDGVASIVTTQAKNRVTALATANPVGRSLRNPQVFQNDLQAYVLTAKTAAYELAAEIRDNHVLSDQGRNALADQLRAAPFFAQAPHSSVIANRTRATKEIELLLYMVHVMNSDYIQQTTHYLRGAHEGTTTRRLGGVEQAATGSSSTQPPAA